MLLGAGKLSRFLRFPLLIKVKVCTIRLPYTFTKKSQKPNSCTDCAMYMSTRDMARDVMEAHVGIKFLSPAYAFSERFAATPFFDVPYPYPHIPRTCDLPVTRPGPHTPGSLIL